MFFVYLACLVRLGESLLPIARSFIPCPASFLQHQVIADFSSLGPGADGRRGITLLSPGFYTISANSDANPTPGHTGLTVKAGTSMATPGTAGYAALVRQYFRMGYYPLGAVDASRGFIPRGALIEAMIVNSAQHMTGTFAGIAANGDRTNARTAFNTQQVRARAGARMRLFQQCWRAMRSSLWLPRAPILTFPLSHLFRVHLSPSPTNSPASLGRPRLWSLSA